MTPDCDDMSVNQKPKKCANGTLLEIVNNNGNYIAVLGGVLYADQQRSYISVLRWNINLTKDRKMSSDMSRSTRKVEISTMSAI